MDLSGFATSFSSPEPRLLSELRKTTWQRTRHGRLMSDPQTGRCLALLSSLIQPLIILEIGTFSGYGTLCLLEGLREDGVLHTIERNDELFDLQDKFWVKAEGTDRIHRHHADAMDVLSGWDVKEQGHINLAYVDADKQGVVDQFEALWPKMADEGVVVFDNTWWSGTLHGPEPARGPKADALRALNARLRDGSKWQSVVLPVGDGLTVVRKQ
jgi:caffeoyl-CoA O-methyltransferase